MNTCNSSDPVFVIGSYRSGTSVLTWCLGQNPNILALEETNWIAYLSVYMDNLYRLGSVNKDRSNLSSIGTTVQEFNSYFGRCINNFVQENLKKYLDASKKRALERPELISDHYHLARSQNDPKERWVDGTPENSHFVYGLNKLFPGAKFIHLLRHPDDVAVSLQNFASIGGKNYSEEDAYRTWLRLVRASLEAESALGSDKVLRIHYADLVEKPEEVIRECLQFIGENFSGLCLAPLKKRINSSGRASDDFTDPATKGKPYINEAHELYKKLITEKPLFSVGDDALYSIFEDKFLRFAKQFRLEEVDKLAAWGCNLDKELNQCHARILELQREVEELGSWGKSLDAAIFEKEKHILNLQNEIDRRQCR
ncbi:MAG TPA: sulfotransferase [Geomonas sp.]|nr:sulfotransferase [Geomonas sp.]